MMLANPHQLATGDPVFFRNNGTGHPAEARVVDRGPLGQFFIELAVGGGRFGVNEDRELFVIVP